MQRRETDPNIRMVDQMTTMKDLTLVVRAMASQTAAAQTQAAPVAPILPHLNNLLSTSAALLPTQATYRKVAQLSVEQIKPSKQIPPATYKRDLPKTNTMARLIQAGSRDVGTDPLTSVSFDPVAYGVSTWGDNYSPASGMSTRESNYFTDRTSATINPPKQSYIDLVPRPVATSTQRKLTTKRILERDHSEMEEAPEVSNATRDRYSKNKPTASAGRSHINGHVKGPRAAVSGQRVKKQTQ